MGIPHRPPARRTPAHRPPAHRHRVLRRSAVAGAAVIALAAAGTAPALATTADHHDGHRDDGVAHYTGLTAAQKRQLLGVARDTWRFVLADTDPTTHLPLDNITYAGGSRTPTAYGRYTSAANVGVYLWSVVSARDLGLVSQEQATRMVRQTLTSVAKLDRYDGFLYQWYDTSTGGRIRGPGDVSCTQVPPGFDNCSFLSQVDNGWYASGLVVVQQALPEVRPLAATLFDQMNFGLFYDDRPQTGCNVNTGLPGGQATGQMYGGYYVGFPPDQGDNWTHYYHNGALYSDPRISAYIGMGTGQMPTDVWWRSWRELPPPAPGCAATDPDFSWQGQWPMPGSWTTVRDPISHKSFPVWEGAYAYTPDPALRFIPTWAGGMFEALMANLVVPESSWGPHSFGLANARTVQVQRRYATEVLGLPVWGMSPSSTPDDTGGYASYGVEGLAFPYHGGGATAATPNQGLSQCHGCASETVITPHASFLALDVAPQAAMRNIDTLRQRYPDVYGVGGFFDALDPTTGAVGHRYLILDQSMILAAIDNAVNDRAMQRHFAASPVSHVARVELGHERMNLGEEARPAHR